MIVGLNQPQPRNSIFGGPLNKIPEICLHEIYKFYHCHSDTLEYYITIHVEEVNSFD